MLKIIHRGIQITALLNPNLLGSAVTSGFLEQDVTNATLLALKGGRVVTKGPDGYIKLADGATDDSLKFLIKDAISGHYENKPALLGQLAITHGPCVLITDQIDVTETFAPGDKLYVGTGAKAGLITKTEPAIGPKKIIGVADSTASASAPQLTILVD